jgi:hypothetical protein
VLRLNGRYGDALRQLAGLEGIRANEERLLSLAAAGRKRELLPLTDSVVARHDTTKVWDSVLVSLGRADPIGSSELLDHLRSRPEIAGKRLAGLLVEDGIRLAPIDSGRAAKRFHEAIRLGSGAESADRAQVELVRLQLASVREPGQLAPLRAALEPVIRGGEAGSSEAVELGLALDGVRIVADSTAAATPQGDLRLFLAAETAREALSAPLLAAGLFRRVAVEWPESPYAPKALLAGQQLDSTWADSARAVLAQQYSASPYLAFTRGEDVPEFQILEDSLQAFAAREPTVRPRGAVRTGPQTQRRLPGGRRLPEDDDRPSRAGARRQPQP